MTIEAEHIMIVDLLRNDLGKICEYGSIDVQELFSIKDYPTVYQMVSCIYGELREKINAEILMITRGAEGVSLFTDDNVQTIGTKARKVHDVSGAGDTAISAFVLADLSGANIEESAIISNYAAGRVCEEVGVVPISLEMIKDIVDHYNN